MLWEAYAEVETQSDNDLDLEDDKNYEKPATVNSKATSSLPCKWPLLKLLKFADHFLGQKFDKYSFVFCVC